MDLSVIDKLKQKLDLAMAEAIEGKAMPKPPTKPSTPAGPGPSNILPKPTNGEAVVLASPEQLEELKAKAAAFYQAAKDLGISFIMLAAVGDASSENHHLISYNLGEIASTGLLKMLLGVDPVYIITGKKVPPQQFINVE